LISGFLAIYSLSNFAQANRVSLSASYEDEDLTLEGKRLKGFAFGAEGLLADWYWMRSLQYIGDKIIRNKSETLDLEDLRPLNPRLLYPMLDNATDLDPKFMAAYSYGSSVLPAIDADRAVKLTEKGIANNPNAWRLYQYLGYIYWRRKEFDKAAEIYERGSHIDGAPSFMRQMEAAMRTQGGSRETAREMYKQMLAEAEDQQSRINAERHLMEIDALDEMDAVNGLLAAKSEQSGTCPKRISDVYAGLDRVRLPSNRDFHVDGNDDLVDPSGVPYILDREKCVIHLNYRDTKVPYLR
jgi:tetratricopeptide (TPR) repeat protein